MAPDWFTQPWPLPEWLTREQYEREQIASALSDTEPADVDAAGDYQDSKEPS